MPGHGRAATRGEHHLSLWTDAELRDEPERGSGDQPGDRRQQRGELRVRPGGEHDLGAGMDIWLRRGEPARDGGGAGRDERVRLRRGRGEGQAGGEWRRGGLLRAVERGGAGGAGGGRDAGSEAGVPPGGREAAGGDGAGREDLLAAHEPSQQREPDDGPERSDGLPGRVRSVREYRL